MSDTAPRRSNRGRSKSLDLSEDGKSNIGHRPMSLGPNPNAGRKRQPTEQQIPRGQQRPRADRDNFFQGTTHTVDIHGRPILLPSGNICTDRDIYCHGFCAERAVFAIYDATVNDSTFPMCLACCDLHDLQFEGKADLGEVSKDFKQMTVQEDVGCPIDIEVKGCIDEFKQMVDKDTDLMFMNYAGLPNDNGQLDGVINALKEKKIFVDEYNRGFLTTGLQWPSARKIIETQPMLKKFLEDMERMGPIKHGFMGHTTMEGTGTHPFHLDGSYIGKSTTRSVASIGKSNKTMTIQNIENGKWFTFKVPHGMVVTMTEVGGGSRGNRYVHRVDGCQGSYIIAFEQ